MITKDTPIIEVLRSNSNAKDIFSKHGMHCIGCMGSSTETIENCAKMHGIDLDKLLAELNATIPN
ncbi:DUF1858 domain-containing protein [Selenomonadales bacterium OttesenSCG-928-I06]|nr:DUF1858 domain-containing protein [Selenomonadales bacterium OttesenSCG-928-I06]